MLFPLVLFRLGVFHPHPSPPAAVPPSPVRGKVLEVTGNLCAMARPGGADPTVHLINPFYLLYG